MALEFLNESKYDDFDPTQPYLERYTVDAHPLSIPWTREFRPPLACFNSSRMLSQQGPWVPSCPFEATSLQMVYVKLDGQGRIGSYVESISTNSSTMVDHLSASVGITVGYPFLNAGVEVDYDKSVMENKNGTRMSRTASCRIGRIIIDGVPRFSRKAIELLHLHDGGARFRDEYGDYYIYGYEIGADAGASLCAESSSKDEEQTIKIRVKVKVLFFDVTSPDVVTKSHDSTLEASMTFIGYSTMDVVSNSLVYPHAGPHDEVFIQQTAAAYHKKLNNLHEDVMNKLKEHKLVNEALTSPAVCADLCREGIIVRLVLAPFVRLNQYLANV
ncbi:hypothetical protein ABW20_dc0100151 [Dactylellina cionopaga]|nr:hypothetical protein ABW20_dc0100151 [Dactylellina cionopaga]